MSGKWFGLTNIALAAIAALITAAILVWSLYKPTLPVAQPLAVKWTRIRTVNHSMVAAMDHLSPLLGELTRPQQPASTQISFRMLGFSDDTLHNNRSILKGPVEDFSNHVVTSAFVFGDVRFAVVDGTLYREGDKLGGSGGILRMITPDKVLIAGRTVRQWIEVNNPDQEASSPATKVASKKTKASKSAQAKTAQSKIVSNPLLPGSAKAAKAKTNGGINSQTSKAIKALQGYSAMLKMLKQK